MRVNHVSFLIKLLSFLLYIVIEKKLKVTNCDYIWKPKMLVKLALRCRPLDTHTQKSNSHHFHHRMLLNVQ